MAKKAHWPNNKGLTKDINGISFYLGIACDLKHGKGWHCQVFDEDFRVGYGFHKTNKFTAVRSALNVLRSGGY